jgi:hypothetical protein
MHLGVPGDFNTKIMTSGLFNILCHLTNFACQYESSFFIISILLFEWRYCSRARSSHGSYTGVVVRGGVSVWGAPYVTLSVLSFTEIVLSLCVVKINVLESRNRKTDGWPKVWRVTILKFSAKCFYATLNVKFTRTNPLIA